MERTSQRLRVVFGLALAFEAGCGAGADQPAPGAPPPQAANGGSSGTPMTPAPAAVAFTQEEEDAIKFTLSLMPAALPKDPSNRLADDGAAAVLGQKFFFETRYSSNGKVSCATCHDPKMGFQDNRANTSSGPIATMFTGRHAPTVINAALGSGKDSDACWHFWDGRADSQWSQALGPPESDVEMGGTRTGIALLLWDHYKAEYEAVTKTSMPKMRNDDGSPVVDTKIKGGTPEWGLLTQQVRDAVNEIYVNFGKAIAAYERKIVSKSARFDAFLADFAAGKKDSTVFTDEEKLGLKVFVGKGLCVSCHRGPNFTDWKFHNVGESQLGSNVPATDKGRAAGLETAINGEFACTSKWSDQSDHSKCAVTRTNLRTADEGAFKTPGLRDITKTAPYMHTGRLKTLEEVVDHYDRGGGSPGTYVGTLSPDVQKLNLTTQEKTALVKFMQTLDGAPLPNALMEAPKLPGQ